ncbi:MAG: alkaline phosphatase family protein [Planctomycetota bacterium]
MSLPRWTVYPALVLIAVLIVIAVPARRSEDPYAGAAGEAAGGSARPDPAGASGRTRFPAVVVLGIDGMDPDILAEAIDAAPELFPNFRWLIAAADGIQVLGTSCPPQSPVAWSNFITGQDPGGHGIFDFIHRDPVTREPVPSTADNDDHWYIGVPGKWRIPVGGDPRSIRGGLAFWEVLRRRGVPADIWRMPANFPVEPSQGLSFSGMMTPALDSAYGECSFFTSDALHQVELDYHKAVLVTENEGVIHSRITGPSNPFKDPDEQGHDVVESVPFTVYVDREAGAAAIQIDEGETVILQPGEWSDFVRLEYRILPMGATSIFGITRFFLRSLEPEFELYASPVNLDPEDPPMPVSEPPSASGELVEAIGRYYTQGMPEDVNALKREVLTDAEFMQQADLVYLEGNRMLDYALDRYVEDDEGGLLFFYYSSVDLISHMMWRHTDPAHPFHDPVLAAQDSSAWSGRPGTTWQDLHRDLFAKFDPVLGRIRERLGDDVTMIVMSDHGFAPYRRKFNLNTWLLEEGYLVLHEGRHREASPADEVYVFVPGVVDWTRTRAYGLGFNGLYLNLKGRELDNPATADEDESGVVEPGPEAEALLAEIKGKLEAIIDHATGLKPIVRCDLTREVYHGDHIDRAPDMQVGYNAGYGNSDEAALGRIPRDVLEDNLGGTFNGSHLMVPDVVHGLLLANRPVRDGFHSLQDLTVEILARFGVERPKEMQGHRVLD